MIVLMRQLARLILMVFATLFIPDVQAATTPVQNNYRVEIIIFANKNPDNFTQEEWPKNIQNPDLKQAMALFDGQTAKGFSVLPEKDYALQSEARRLEESGRYIVLAHLAWQQPGFPAGKAIPVSITAGRDYAPEYPALTMPKYTTQNGKPVEIPGPTHLYRLSGTIKVVLGRFLHFYTNLVLNVPSVNETNNTGATQLVEDIPMIDQASTQPATGGTLTKVHMIQQRRTRSRILNYMDNPMIGVLFEIWPIGNSR